MNTNYRQYMRRYRVLVTSKSTGLSYDMSELRCAFNVTKKLNSSPDYAQIVIFNATNDFCSSVTKGDKVVLEAGYKDGNYGLIYVGQVVQCYMRKTNSVDTEAVLVCSDGDQFLTQTVIVKTIGAGATQADIVNECVSAADKDADIALGEITSTLSSNGLARGKVMFGNASAYLDKIAQSNNAQFYVSDGQVNIVAAEDYGDNVAVLLTPATGLLETPEQTDDGIKGKCLLNPSLRLNTRIYIDNQFTNAMQVTKDKTPKAMNSSGIYKVITVTYSGDTRGESWFCDFEGVSMTGNVLSGLTEEQMNAWR